MSSVRAVVVDDQAPSRLGIREVSAPTPQPGQVLVRVEASSLNRGDVLAAQAAEPGWRPGHDVAGTVVQAADDGSGPPVGARVVGLLDAGAWCDLVVADADRFAVLPDEVTFAQASTLPTAGLTAHRALEKGGLLLGKRVLITGSTGGVGLFAHQLAAAAGAFAVGTTRQAKNADAVRALGADEVVVGEDLAAAREHGPFDLILESTGGASLRAALGMLGAGGTCVSFGWSASPMVDFDLREFLGTGACTLYGLRMYSELDIRPACGDLDLLARMIAAGTLRVPIEAQGSWDDLGRLADGLMNRSFTGKAVLNFGDS